MILLDTDVCIEILRGSQSVIEKRQRCDERVAISFMTIGELYYGAERSKSKMKNVNVVDEFVLSIETINTDLEILKKFGELKAYLRVTNEMVPDADIMIASAAITKCTKLITGNIKHFNRFPELVLENWII